MLGKGDITTDVFTRPDFYLNAISLSINFLHAFLILAIGFIGIKRGIPFWQIIILQATSLFNDVLFFLFCRVNPDLFFIIVKCLFILVYLIYGFNDQSQKKFAIGSGVIMALGFATKFNFFPLLFLPLFLINTNKNRLLYTGVGFISFIIFIAPIIDKFKGYKNFLINIMNHDGLYGSGVNKIFNLHKIFENLGEIFRINPGLLFLIICLVIGISIAFYKDRNANQKKQILLFIGLLFIAGLQMIMVSKHFKNYYLAPLFTIYGFIFFLISVFLSRMEMKKKYLLFLSFFLPIIFLIATSLKIFHDFPIIINNSCYANFFCYAALGVDNLISSSCAAFKAA